MHEPSIFELINQRAIDWIINILNDPNRREQALIDRWDGMTALHYAITLYVQGQHDDGLRKIVFLLLDATTDTPHINAHNMHDYKSLDIALHHGAFNLALHILIRGGKADANLLNDLVNHPPEWADFHHAAFISLLLQNRDCAVFVARLLLGDGASVIQLGTLYPALVNQLTNRAWYIFIDFALMNGCDAAVAQLLPMVHRIPGPDLFFRAFRRGAPESQKTILKMVPENERLILVLEAARRLIENEAYNAALALLSFTQGLLNSPDFIPNQDFPTVDIDLTEGGIDFAIPADSQLHLEDDEDEDSIAGQTAENLLSSLLLMTTTSNYPELLDHVIYRVLGTGITQDVMESAVATSLPEMAADRADKFIRRACQRVNIPRDAKTQALVNAFNAGHLKSAATLLLFRASPNCCIQPNHWLSLDPNQQGGQLQHCVIYQLLRTEENGEWLISAAKFTYLLLTFGGQIEFWDVQNPDQNLSVLCIAATAGHVNVIRRAVQVGANPVMVLQMACNNPTQAHMKECVIAALEGLIEVLNLFDSTNSFDVISVLVRGLSAGGNGRDLIWALISVANCAEFADDIRNAARICSERLEAFFARERKLYDHSIVTLIEHSQPELIDTQLQSLQLTEMPVWLISACSGDRPPSLTALLAWLKVLNIPGFAQEIELVHVIQWHQYRPQPPADDDAMDEG